MPVHGGRDAEGARLGNRLAEQVDERVADARVLDACGRQKKLHRASGFVVATRDRRPAENSSPQCGGGAHESTRSSSARSFGSPWAGRTSSTGRSSSGRSRSTTSSRVTCLRPPSWTSSPLPKSESESPLTIALIEGNQRIRSLSSRPG